MVLKAHSIAAFLLIVAGASHATDTSSAKADASDAKRGAAVDALFAEYAQPGNPGAAVGIYRRGQRLYARGYGLANLEHAVPITSQTVFNLASVSKQFVAFSIALLAREGKVDLDADIRTYLPWMPDFGTRITVEQLVHHTGGLRDYIGLAALGGRDDSALVRQQHLLDLMQRQRALNFEPGSEYGYSNSGYALLAEIVRAASGQAPRAFMQERIFGPLGMTRTRLRDALSEVVPDYAIGYQRDKGGQGWARALYNRETIGPGNVLSSVEDLGRWAQHLASLAVKDPAFFAQITTSGQLSDGTPTHYGFGLFRQTLAGREVIMHTGGVTGFATVFTWFPAEDFAVIVLANRAVDASGLAEQLASLYLGVKDDAEVRGEPAVARPGPAELETLAGAYQSNSGPVLIFEAKDGGMFMRYRGVEVVPLVFWADGTFGFGGYRGVRFRPLRSAAGQVAALEEVPGTTTLGNGNRYSRATLVKASAAALAQFAGEYHSAEIDTRYTLAVESGQLALRSLWLTEPQFFVATTADRFEATPGPLAALSLSVQRDAAGAPTGLLFNYPGIRSLLVSKAASAALP